MVVKQLKELLKLTKEYPLICSNLKNREKSDADLITDKLKVKLLLNERKQLKEKIQIEMGFIIPNYIIDEIIENKNDIGYSNLFCLINMAIINNRISKYNAKKLKLYISNNIK